MQDTTRRLRHVLAIKKSYLYGPIGLPAGVLIAWIVIAIRNFQKGSLFSFSVIFLFFLVVYMFYYVKDWISNNKDNAIYILADGFELSRFNTDFKFEFTKMSDLKLYDIRHKRIHVDVFEFTYDNQPFVILSQGYDRTAFVQIFSNMIENHEGGV